MARVTVRGISVRLMAALLVASLTGACSESRTGAATSPGGGGAPSPSPTGGYDLRLVADHDDAEVNEPFTIRFTVTNSGPGEALGIITMQDLFELGGVELWADPEAFRGGRLISFDPGKIAGGDATNRNAVLRFIEPGTVTLHAHVAPDEPPDRNPADNQVSMEVVVASPTCTDPRGAGSGRRGVTVTNAPRRQVVCTGRGGDSIQVGDRDAVRSGGGADSVSCRQGFCVIDLGRGDDVATCAKACFVDGGPGRDTCPRGRAVLTRDCER